jgi:hypothetical protein
MKHLIVVLIIALFLCGACEEEASPPELWIDIAPPIWAGNRSIDPEISPRDFNLQLTNRGDEVLVIDSVVKRGDRNCAFVFEGPDVSELMHNESAFIRVLYKPLVAEKDQVAMEISSNSHINPLLVLPICGQGVVPGSEDPGEFDCTDPPANQADCPDDLEGN